MSYSTDPALDASRHYDALYARQDLEDRARADMADDFLRACRRGDANALATWAPKCTDYTGQPYLIGGKQVRPQRYQTVAEVMADTLDFTGGPASVELYQLLLNAAAGADVQAQVNELLGRMAVVFAKFNAEAA